jgi:hypothetical protein
LDGSVAGTNVSPDVFVGARFEVDHPIRTTRIGGHFIGHPLNANAEFFGALVALEDETDLPDSDDLSSSDVLGVAYLEFPGSSDEVFTDLAVTLNPGWHAVVFGSGFFGTTAVGGALRNGLDNGPQSYIGWQPGVGWIELSQFFPPLFTNHRFVVEGTFIPEPITLSETVIGLLLFSRLVPRRRTDTFGSSQLNGRVPN